MFTLHLSINYCAFFNSSNLFVRFSKCTFCSSIDGKPPPGTASGGITDGIPPSGTESDGFTDGKPGISGNGGRSLPAGEIGANWDGSI